MPQLNIHLTPGFEKNLTKFMKLRHIPTKSEAIRVAIQESLARTIVSAKPSDFRGWMGIALKAPVNKKPKFISDDDLWG